jgi:hypothetical protein
VVLVFALIAFGGYFAPMAEVKLGLGYEAVAARTNPLTVPFCPQRHILRGVGG